jgi:hypothetical protein
MDPGTWIYWIVMLVGVAYSMSNKPKTQRPSALTLDDVKIPLVEIGKEIPVLFGTRDIEDPHVIWYGDLRTVPVKSKGGKK